jgi:predicted nucleic acid-binding protein
LTEIGRVLAYPKIRRILRWDDETTGSADWLVTADGDLISLRDDFPILRPSEFAVRL